MSASRPRKSRGRERSQDLRRREGLPVLPLGASAGPLPFPTSRIPMTKINKTAMQAALLIQEKVAQDMNPATSCYLPEHAWNNMQRLRRQIDLARERGWHRAASDSTKSWSIDGTVPPRIGYRPPRATMLLGRSPRYVGLKRVPRHPGPLRRVRGSGYRPGRARTVASRRTRSYWRTLTSGPSRSGWTGIALAFRPCIGSWPSIPTHPQGETM